MIIEVGVQKGGSLSMLSKVFPKAKIFGIDIDPECSKVKYENPNVEVVTGFRFEPSAHHPFENFQGQQGAALRQGSIGNVFAGEFHHMCRQFAGASDHMEDQTTDQFGRTHHGRTATAETTTVQPSVDELPGEHRTKKILEGSSGDDSVVSHPQLNGVLTLKVQA